MIDEKMNVGFVGGGNMARAMIAGLLHSGHDPDCLHISDPSAHQRERIVQKHGDLHVTDDNAEIAETADILVLAVKPQIALTVASDLRNVRRPGNQLALSIAAGVSLHSLESALAPTRAIVRVMPNQPALVGAGISVMVATPDTGDQHRRQAQYVAEAMGRAIWIENESLMDAVTAISGSGPAYFYLLMEIMEHCAVEMGIPEDLARTLTRQTGLGAGRVATESESDLSRVRESVTSKGGSTAAAIEILEQAGIRDIVQKALAAARDRSIELGIAGSTAANNEGDISHSKDD